MTPIAGTPVAGAPVSGTPADGVRGVSRARLALAATAIAGIPTALAVDAQLARARGWWTTSSLPEALAGVAALALVAVVWLLRRPRTRAALARSAAALVACVSMLVVAWLIAEFAVEKLVGDKLWFHRRIPRTQATFHPDPAVMPGVSGQASYTANGLGMRGGDWPARNAAHRVLCVGGSTTACLFLDDRECWPALLQAQLERAGATWVGDVGKSGYGTWHHVRFVEDTTLLREVDTVVLLVGINDFMRALQGRRIAAALGVHPLYERSRIYTVLHNVYQARKEQRQDREEFGSGEAYVARRRKRAQADKRAGLPDLAATVQEYRSNLRTIVAQCQACGARPVLATQPVLWAAGLRPEDEALLWLGECADGSYLEVPALVQGMRVFNDGLRAVASECGCACIDLSAMDGERAFFFDDCHFTEAGAARVAELLAAGWPR